MKRTPSYIFFALAVIVITSMMLKEREQWWRNESVLHSASHYTEAWRWQERISSHHTNQPWWSWARQTTFAGSWVVRKSSVHRKRGTAAWLAHLGTWLQQAVYAPPNNERNIRRCLHRQRSEQRKIQHSMQTSSSSFLFFSLTCRCQRVVTHVY